MTSQKDCFVLYFTGDEHQEAGVCVTSDEEDNDSYAVFETEAIAKRALHAWTDDGSAEDAAKYVLKRARLIIDP